ncbi:MAG: hypothetical protein WCS31_02395 [Verrucomicrobiae bacterium]
MKYLKAINLHAAFLNLALSLSGWALTLFGNAIGVFPLSLAGVIINSFLYPAFFAMIRNPAWDQAVPAGWNHAIPNDISILIGFLQILLSTGAVAYFVKTRRLFLLPLLCLASMASVAIAVHISLMLLGYKILLFTN